MIVSEHRLRDIVGTMPEVRLNDSISNKPFFGWGGKAELNRYLAKKEAPYPLIWLLPTEDDHINRGQRLSKTCELIIATQESRKDLFNDQRYILSFDTILNPTTDYLIQGLQKASIVSVVSPEWGVFKFPNYSEADSNFTIELWDAVKLTIDVEFNDSECLGTIIYN